jgi:hypothetical protein
MHQQRSLTSSSSSSSRTISYSNTPPISTNIVHPYPLFTRNNRYQPAPNVPSSNFRYVSNDNLTRNNSGNSIYESFRRRSYSLSPVSSPNLRNPAIDQNDRYYFGRPSESFLSDEENCLLFSRPSHPRLFTNDITLAKVSDAGTSTDNASLDQVQPDTTVRNQTFYPQQAYLVKQQSSFTSQSSRTESETYRPNKQDTDQGNYEQFDIDPLPTVKYPESISPIATSTAHPYSNVKETNAYESDDTDISQSKEKPSQNENIERLGRQNPLMDISPSPPTYTNVIDDRTTESSRSEVSITSAKSRRSIFNFFRLRKTNGKPKKKTK